MGPKVGPIFTSDALAALGADLGLTSLSGAWLSLWLCLSSIVLSGVGMMLVQRGGPIEMFSHRCLCSVRISSLYPIDDFLMFGQRELFLAGPDQQLRVVFLQPAEHSLADGL